MGTYRPHTLVRGRSVWKSRKISRKKPIWAAAAIEEHYWALCALLDIFCYFYLECPLSDHHPVPCSGLVRSSKVRIPSAGSWLRRAQALEVFVPWPSTLQNMPALALLLEWFSYFCCLKEALHILLSAALGTITPLRAALCCYARRKNVNLNKPPSQWYLKTDCRISSRFCKALFKNNSYIFIFQLANRELF